MNDKEIIEYCRNLIKANLNQYIDTPNSIFILKEISDLEYDNTNKTLLEHCKGLQGLLEKCINILEGETNEKI